MYIRSDPAAAPDNENLGLDAGSFLTQNNILAEQICYFLLSFFVEDGIIDMLGREGQSQNRSCYQTIIVRSLHCLAVSVRPYFSL